MFRVAIVAVVLSGLVPSVCAQTQPAPAAGAAQGAPSAKKSAPKAKAPAKQLPTVETGPCRLGVISAFGDRFSVQKFGVTVFEAEYEEVPVNGWGLDEIAFARVRSRTGADPSVRRIAYPKGAFEPFYNPKSRLLPDASERLETIVQNITTGTNCERYLVFFKTIGQLPGTTKTTRGIGAYNQGLGSAFRSSQLFANITAMLIDGRSYQKVDPAFAWFGSGGVTPEEFDLSKLDNALFPDPPQSAAGNATLRDKTRALVSARIDTVIPRYLKD